MKQAFATVAFALGASAATLRRSDDCCFQLTASGGVSGVLGQLDDGQNRVNGSYPAATYCINGNGAITDSMGRGCILTPPTTQFQCDSGATPTSGFTVSSNGELEHNGDDQFYACPATDNEYNIYTTPVDNQPKCKKITVSTGGKCESSKQSSSSVLPSLTATTTAATQSSASAQTVTHTATQYVTVTANDCSLCSATSVVYSPVVSTAVAKSTVSIPVGNTIVSSMSVYDTTTVRETSVATESAPTVTTKATESKSVESSPATVVKTTVATSVESVPVTVSKVAVSTAPVYASSSASATSASVCQTSLTGAYQTPHLIVPVSSESPNTAYGTSYNGQINSTMSSIFNFDIPQSYEGKTCSVIFLFPQKSQLETSDYTFNGKGDLVFAELSSAASQSTSWSNVPAVKSELNSIAIQEGNSYVVSTGSCQAGMVESIELSSANGLALEFFEDWNPASLGLYITAC